MKGSPGKTSSRVVSMDVLRLAAMVLLLMAHIGQEIRHPLGKFFGIRDFYWVSWGGVAVTIFLVLSGAALQLQYGSRPFRLSEFLAKRLLRIYPVYWMSLFVAVAAALLKSTLRTGDALAAFPRIHGSDITLGLTGTYAFAGEWGGPFNGVTWFVALILSMYFLYPLLARGFRKHPHWTLAATVLLSVGSRLLIGKYKLIDMRPLDWFPLCRVFEFTLGMALVRAVSLVRWRLPEVPAWLGRALSFLGRLTFPLFLVHYPVIFLIGHFKKGGMSQGAAIGLFLVISLSLALLVQFLDDRLPRQWVLKKLGFRRREEPGKKRVFVRTGRRDLVTRRLG